MSRLIPSPPPPHAPYQQKAYLNVLEPVKDNPIGADPPRRRQCRHECNWNRGRLSTRTIIVKLPASVFWDPRKKETHHHNYPQLTNIEYEDFVRYAKKRREIFRPGGKIFENTLERFKSNTLMSSSIKPSVWVPFPAEVLPLIVNNFQESKKVLARFLATADSLLPNVNLNIMEPFTSWGRSTGNTLRSTIDERIPNYAFKLLLFKRGFYISTEAVGGIYINNVKLGSHASDKPGLKAKTWGELRHKDTVTVWWDTWNGVDCIRFQFECLRGLSREPRYSDGFDILHNGEKLKDIEKKCLEVWEAG